MLKSQSTRPSTKIPNKLNFKVLTKMERYSASPTREQMKKENCFQSRKGLKKISSAQMLISLKNLNQLKRNIQNVIFFLTQIRNLQPKERVI